MDVRGICCVCLCVWVVLWGCVCERGLYLRVRGIYVCVRGICVCEGSSL